MAKKKISFSMKSEFAFERIYTTFSNMKLMRGNLDIYSENLNTYDGIEDLLELWTPELIVVDTRLDEKQRIEDLIKKKNMVFLYFENDYEALIEQVKLHFELEEPEEVEENEDESDISYIKGSESEKVIIQDRIIEKEVVRTEFTAMANKVIVVASLWQGAGSTTLGVNLARAISERGLEVSYVEYPMSKPYMFDYLSIPMVEENSEREERYIDVSQDIKNEGRRINKKSIWKQNGINWYVTDTRKEPLDSFNYEELMQLVYSINSVITIVDVSHHLSDPVVQKFLHNADDVLVCIEPDPVKIDWLSTVRDKGIITNRQRPENRIISYLNEIETNEDVPYHFVTMKYTNNINRDEWLPSLEKEPIAFIPALPHKDLIYSVWSSTFIYDDEQYNETLEKAMYPIITKFLPRHLYNLKEKKKKSLINIFKKERTK